MMWGFILVLILLIVVAICLLLQQRVDKYRVPAGFDDWRVQEQWEDYPAVDYGKVYTYCSVTFADSEKVFYYRTRNPELKVGDLVYVPVGYHYEKKVGQIVEMKAYLGSKAPYPLEKTKYIIDKVSRR